MLPRRYPKVQSCLKYLIPPLTYPASSTIQYLVMVKFNNPDEDKLYFTPEGEAAGYISFDQIPKAPI